MIKKEGLAESVFRFAEKSNAVWFTLTPAQLDFFLRNKKGNEKDIALETIKEFSNDAISIIEKAGIRFSRNKKIKRDELPMKDILNLYLEGTEKDVLLSNAGRVIGSANACCAAIEKGNAESAAIEMMRLCFAITSMAMRETILQGIGTKAGQSTGGTQSRKLKGIEAATRKRLQKKDYTAGEVWFYFRKFTDNSPLIIGEYEICMRADHANEKNPERLYQNEQSITLKTFENYVSEIKERLRFEEMFEEVRKFSPGTTKEMLRACLKNTHSK